MPQSVFYPINVALGRPVTRFSRGYFHSIRIGVIAGWVNNSHVNWTCLLGTNAEPVTFHLCSSRLESCFLLGLSRKNLFLLPQGGRKHANHTCFKCSKFYRAVLLVIPGQRLGGPLPGNVEEGALRHVELTYSRSD